MPIKECQIDGKPGYKWGDQGKCYTYEDSESSKKSARSKAHRQGIVIEGFNLQSLSNKQIIENEFVETYTDYPQAATENAKIALRWVEKNGWGSCGTAVGKVRANQLANREPLSRDTIARMAAFERHRQNSQKSLGDGCGRLMWLCWGGDAGIEWAQRKLKQIDKE